MAKLDLNKLKSKMGKPITTEESFLLFEPINYPKEVLDGTKKVYVSNIDENGLITLEIL